MEDTIYTPDEKTVETQVVALLTRYGKTVATAESCTGGLVSARLTGVPGSSRAFGTGVVSYSYACKQKLLQVSPDTLQQEGAVCAATAGQMARGVRQLAAADIGVAVTGEAGPVPGEAHPVGTVFIALADGKRTWVTQLHLTGDRQAIRHQAASEALGLLHRYLEAYPTVIAGGVSNRSAQRTIPRTQGEAHPRLLSRLLPWRGDTPGRVAMKCAAWLAALAVLAAFLYTGYHYLVAPDINRELQSSLGDMYREDGADLTVPENSREYPLGMMAPFRGLYDKNPDIGGWIHIEGTAVDYPVMQYGEGQYRNHNFEEQYSIYGQPYFGEDTDLAAGPVLTVYGRNTGDGQMFSDLLNYRRVAYLQEHGVIQLDTLFDSACWEIFAVLVVDENNPEECPYAQPDVADEEAYEAYLAMLQERSLFESDQAVTAENRILLLSVNAGEEYGFSAARLVIAAREMAGEESEATYRVNPGAQLPQVLVQRTTTYRTQTTTVTTTEVPTTTTKTTTTEMVSTTKRTIVTRTEPTATESTEMTESTQSTETTVTEESTTTTTSTTASDANAVATTGSQREDDPSSVDATSTTHTTQEPVSDNEETEKQSNDDFGN